MKIVNSEEKKAIRNGARELKSAEIYVEKTWLKISYIPMTKRACYNLSRTFGQVVLTGSIYPGGETKSNLRHLSKGPYLVTIIDGETKAEYKINV